MKKSYLFSLLISIMFTTNIFALTLDDALVATYNNSKKIKKAEMDFLSSIESFPQAFSRYFLPDINANLNLRDTKTTTTQSTASIKNLGLDRSITITQPLFDGGSGVAALKSAQHAFGSARAKLYDDGQQVFMEVIKSYAQYIESNEIYSISDASLNFREKELESAEAKFKAGEATKSDIAIAKSKFANSKYNKSVAYNNLQGAKAKFKELIGIDAQENEIKDVIMPMMPKNFDEFSNKVNNNNFALDYTRHALKAAKSDVLVESGNLLPSLDTRASIGKSYKDLHGRNSESTKTLTTSLNLNIPILSKGGAEYSKIRIAKNKAKKTNISLDLTSKEIETQKIALWEKWITMQSQMDSAKEAVEAGAIALESMKQEYGVGSKTLIDVLNAEDQFYQMKNQYAQAKTQLVSTAYSIKELMGELTPHAMNLKVKYFKPEAEFNKIKMKIVGF